MPDANGSRLSLDDGSRVAVVGGGPAGAFFSFFLLEMAKTAGLRLHVTIYEPRDFTRAGPPGCNMCGGIVSESLVQKLAAEGIHLGPDVVQRSIDSYYLHMDVGDVRIDTPLREKRIASVHRGGGPRGIKEIEAGGLDEHLLQLAIREGAELRRERVNGLDWEGGRPRITTSRSAPQAVYDLLVAAVGVNSSALKLFEHFLPSYRAPVSTKTSICEFCFGRDLIQRELGSAMHVFLLNMPRLEFAALIPKGCYVTLCLLGKDIDKALVQQFLQRREVRQALPPNWAPPPDFCHCSPRISVESAVRPFADRVVFVGDCGTTRLYKDGIGAAYRTAKAAARTAIFHGISADDFHRYYWPVCKRIRADNRSGKFVFFVTRLIQKTAFVRRGLWRMVSGEQFHGRARRMSTVLWDIFTGSTPYREVLVRTLHPAFIGRFAYEMLRGARHIRDSSE